MTMTTMTMVSPAPSQAPSQCPSASSLLSLLTEPCPSIVSSALSQLHPLIDSSWHMVASSLPLLEAIAESDSYDQTVRAIAASVASRVFFHLEEPRQALRLALESGYIHNSININIDTDTNSNSNNNKINKNIAEGPYVHRMIECAIEEYIAIKTGSEPTMDTTKLEALVDSQFQRCFHHGNYRTPIGVTHESHDKDRLTTILSHISHHTSHDDCLDLLHYTMTTALHSPKPWRITVLTSLVQTLESLPPSIEARHLLLLTLQLLRDSQKVATILTQLLHSETTLEEGYQYCFDLVDSGDLPFVSSLSALLPPSLLQAHRVLTGGFPSELHLSFLYKHSQSDALVMRNLKRALEERTGLAGRNSVLHNCAVCANGYLNAGTTGDGFLRDHLEWMRKAAHWAKFSATASMGVIHAGHTTEAMTLLEPYLPPTPPAENDPADHPPVSSTGGFSEGGSLYALGLIHGSHVGTDSAKRIEASAFLRRHLRHSHANEAISHGAALGVGLTSFGSGNLEVVNELKELLYTDSAVAGEAASIAMGMVLAGTGAGNASSSTTPERELLDEIVAELRNYSRETQHEKIIRGIAICLALINFGQEENADATMDEMRGDRDPIIRYGSMYGLALAYCGTGSNKAVRILLHTAVSDVNDDVRMASVIGLALVLHKTPHRVPELVSLLLESFNPHVRYASCMAVGIAMAGSGDAKSVAMLEPMLTDMTDYVRQGALMGTAMIYMQQNDSCNHRKIKTFREQLITIIGDKHQSTLSKMGAILSTGLIDVGGRNCALSLGSRNGFTKMNNAVGLVLWLQHWHWFPMMHMLSLAITPTCTIGLNKDFKYPKKFEIVCNSKPSAFAYPKKLEEKKEEEKKRVKTVTLSTTAKNKARMARKRAKEEAEGEDSMDIENKESTKEDTKMESMDVDGEDKDAKPDDDKADDKPKKKREPEPTSFRVSNPSRVTKAQADLCVFDLNQRYRPIRPQEKPYGVIILIDSCPGGEEDLGMLKTPAQEEEAEPPEPFEWTPPGLEESAAESMVALEAVEEAD